MLPINARELQKQLKQLKRLGVKIEQIENAKKASIELNDKILVVESPDVFIVEFGNQKMFYIVAQNVREESITITAEKQPQQYTPLTVSDEDVQFVAEYAGVSLDKAREAIARAGGDIAKAIEIIESEKRAGSTIQ